MSPFLILLLQERCLSPRSLQEWHLGTDIAWVRHSWYGVVLTLVHPHALFSGEEFWPCILNDMYLHCPNIPQVTVSQAWKDELF